MKALAFATMLLAATATSRAADRDVSAARVTRLDHWLHAVAVHAPGQPDENIKEVSGWSSVDLEFFRIDLDTLLRLTRDLKLSTFRLPAREVDCLDCFAARRDVTQARLLRPAEVIRYSDQQLHRLRVLACAAAGLMDNAICISLNAERELDLELRHLATLAAAARREGDANFIFRRGALFQTDVAIATADMFGPIEPTGLTSGQPMRMHITDGEAVRIGTGDTHWAIASALADGIVPRPDAMTRLWYVATNAWMQNAKQYNPVHLERARALFPGDSTIAFLSGTQAETYASLPFQSAAKTAVLPPGFITEIGNEASELKAAETFLRRAVTLDPTSAEAHLHLGHVLLQLGKIQDALPELRAASISAEVVLQYFAALFLGAAQEGLSRPSDAKAAYEHAAALFPRAQSPRLALSTLAAKRDDRQAATSALDALFTSPTAAETRDDPWWRYDTTPGRHTEELLETLWMSFRNGSH